MPTPATLDYSSLPFPVRVELIPESQRTQNPGIPLVPRFLTFHDTGNPNPGANARFHQRWQLDGARNDAGHPQQLSVHFYTDDVQSIQTMPLNRVSWHAGDGDGPGNLTSLSFELCINSDRNRARAEANQCLLIATVAKALGLTPDNVVQHNHWSGKDCPATIRHTETWPRMLTTIAGHIGGALAPVAAFAPPDIPSWIPQLESGRDQTLGHAQVWACKRRWTVAKRTPRRRYSELDAKKVGPDLNPGETFVGLGIFENASGWWILTKWGTRILMNDVEPAFTLAA